MLQSTDKKLKFIFYIAIFIFLSTQITINPNTNKILNLKINNIEVFGLSKENNLKVSKNLSTLLFKNIFFISEENLQEILEKNYLIETFAIKKIYPNKLEVNIKQTNFLAITYKENEKFYIGSNGKLIPFDSIRNKNKNLPLVFSKNNYIDFIKLKKIIDKSKFKFEDIDSFYHYPSNRWDFKTNDGLLIKLPRQNVIESLEFINLIKLNPQFNSNGIIDLRIANYITVSDE